MASQLQDSEVQGNSVPNPYTIPSILYSPEEAGGFNCEYVYEIGQKGLGVLQHEDSRFKNYIIGKKRRGINDYSPKEPHNQMIVIHMYDWEDLIFCSLPYHSKPEFVRILQLVRPNGKSKWDFLLDCVQQSGVPLHRRFIFDNCIRDMQIINSLCEYACESRTKKYKLSKIIFMFTISILVEVSTRITTLDEVKPVLVLLEQGIQSGGSYKAFALMIIFRLPLQQSPFLTWIVKTSQDYNWVRLSVIMLTSFIKLHSVTYIPRNILVNLIKIEDFDKVLLGISKEFDISGFLDLLVDSCLHSYDTYEYRFSEALASIIKAVPIGNVVDLTSKVLHKSMIQQGEWARTILLAINKKYPVEILEAVETFLDTEIQMELKLNMLSQMMDFCELDKVALGLAYKTTLLKCLK